MLSPCPDKDICPLMIDREQLHQNGYQLLRQAVPANWLDELRATFEAGVIAPQQWPVPRGHDWRHALVDLDARVQAVCRLPAVLAVAGELIGDRFFLAQVEGREPLPGGGHQVLHRDLSEQRLGDRAIALVYLDDYGPANGATRIVPGSHRPGELLAPFDFSDESHAVQLSGAAGDILLFDADLVHGASLNPSGARRRSLLISYCAQGLYEAHLQTLGLRFVRMDTSERFEPADFV
ncbi:Phytanoyl-CoA dioxygenase [Pseudomonas sp. CMR5c]|nr:Phytanoyl-CoA dioxygenase [Pseudomonas sp. CMR5c]